MRCPNSALDWSQDLVSRDAPLRHSCGIGNCSSEKISENEMNGATYGGLNCPHLFRICCLCFGCLKICLARASEDIVFWENPAGALPFR
ncbi:hypothetical protein BRADI_3g06021v3 [Brachypodium distachyon]|uniref:Uncharacterized protein n=1 Tax=Brachypodium distachyon TaxID=15368 RepID=A0A0Q3PW45_BRADI|nr:hypothetical protein BRADI_3g06021v3 [Brachypodium distachyon]